MKTYIKYFKKVLKYFLNYELFMKLEKYIFSLSEISFLSFVFTIKDYEIDLC